MREEEIDLVEAALNWWRSKRPVDWSETQHCKDPTIGRTSINDKALAEACGGVWANHLCMNGLWDEKNEDEGV